MRKLLILIIFIPSLLLAEEVVYPDTDTAIRNGVKYKAKHKASIYQDIDKAKDPK
jgi:hypothetical protein